MWSVIRVQETPSKAAGPRDPGVAQLSCALWRAEGRCRKRIAVLSTVEGVGAVVCCQGEFPFAGCSSKKLVLGRRCEGTSALSGRAGSGGMAGPRAQKAFVRPVLLAHEGEPVGSGFAPPETPSKEAGPREPGAGQPRFALWRAWCRWRKRLVLLSGSEARWGCGLLPEECFTLQNAVPRSSFWAFGATRLRR